MTLSLFSYTTDYEFCQDQIYLYVPFVKSLMILCIISSAGASSPAVPTNVGSRDGSSHGHGSRAASLSCVGSQPPRTSLSTSAGGSAFGSSRPSCRPWERGDLLRRLATFKPLNWFGKPKVCTWLGHEFLSVNLFVICGLRYMKIPILEHNGRLFC